MAVEEPTVQELEEAITHVRATIARYGEYAHKYPELHAELDHLLTEWQEARAKDQGLTPVAPIE